MKVVQLLVFVSAIFVSETRAADSIEVPLVPSGDVLTTTETISTNAPIFFQRRTKISPVAINTVGLL